MSKRCSSHLCKDLVSQILLRYPPARDCDIRLRWCVIRALGFDPNKLTLTEALRLEKEKQVPNAESIRRTRAKLQEEQPLLRGELYEECHKKQKEWIKELGYRDSEAVASSDYDCDGDGDCDVDNQ